MCHTGHRMHFARSNGLAHGIFRFPESSGEKAGFPDDKRILSGLSGGRAGFPDDTDYANKKPPEKVANKKAAGETPTAFY